MLFYSCFGICYFIWFLYWLDIDNITLNVPAEGSTEIQNTVYLMPPQWSVVVSAELRTRALARGFLQVMIYTRQPALPHQISVYYGHILMLLTVGFSVVLPLMRTAVDEVRFRETWLPFSYILRITWLALNPWEENKNSTRRHGQQGSMPLELTCCQECFSLALPQTAGVGEAGFQASVGFLLCLQGGCTQSHQCIPHNRHSIIQPELITSVCLFITTFAMYIGVCSEAQSAFIGHL